MTDSASFPPRQLWATAREGGAAELSSIPTPLLRQGEPVAFIGGKLAAALIGPLEEAGYPLVSSARRHPVLDGIPPEEAEYEAFGHGHGEVHTAREFRQLVERCTRAFAPEEDRWREDDRVVDPFRPGLRYAALSDQEFGVLQERHLNTVRTAFRRAKTVVVSLSQSEVWISRADGAAFPRWITAAERHFDPEKHAVRALTVEETVLDLAAAVRALRELNPGLGVVLMISPEPQLATAHPAHVLVAGALGKAVLRIAMEVVAATEHVAYFPALELAALQAPANAYGPDGAIPSQVTAAITQALLAIGEGGAAIFEGVPTPVPVLRTVPTEPHAPKRPRPGAAADAEGSGTDAASAASRKRKPKSLSISVVDPYSMAQAAEAQERAQRRATQTLPSDGAAPTLTVAERQAMRQEKLAAREARVAAAGAAPPQPTEAPAALRSEREKARTESVKSIAAEPAASGAAKAERKAKKAQAKSVQVASEASTDTATRSAKPRRERRRPAKS